MPKQPALFNELMVSQPTLIIIQPSSGSLHLERCGLGTEWFSEPSSWGPAQEGPQDGGTV